MSTTLRRLAIGSLALIGLLAGHGVARAQFYNPYGGGYNPYLAQQQYLYNLQMSRAASANSMVYANPSLALPYNQMAYNPYLSYGANPYTTGSPGFAAGSAGSNPYSPYGGAAGAYDSYTNPYSNPYAGAAAYNPYSQIYNSPGFTLMGAADVIRGYGTGITKQEEARILREKAYQEQVKTEKDKFDLRMYIKANTPSWSEEQARAAKLTLKRIQSNSSPLEVAGGRSLNYLLDDVRKHRGKEFSFGKIELPDEVLGHVNVTTKNNSLGVLRDGGKLRFPNALAELIPANARNDMEARTQAIVQNAANGKIDANALRDLNAQVDQIREQLTKKSNEIPTPQYLEAKRYLNDLEDAGLAIANGEAGAQFEYQKLVNEGKVRDVTDLINQMVARGWRFAPATPADEAAYRALHSALAAYDLALNSAVGE